MSTTRSPTHHLLVSLGILAAAVALPAGAAELPKSTQKMLSDLKLSTDILKGLDRELRMPAGWVKGAKLEGVVKIKLLEIKRGGRILVFKAKGKKRRIKISGRRTMVYIKGALDDRSNLKVGMSCEITHPENGNEAKKVSCP